MADLNKIAMGASGLQLAMGASGAYFQDINGELGNLTKPIVSPWYFFGVNVNIIWPESNKIIWKITTIWPQLLVVLVLIKMEELNYLLGHPY